MGPPGGQGPPGSSGDVTVPSSEPVNCGVTGEVSNSGQNKGGWVGAL